MHVQHVVARAVAVADALPLVLRIRERKSLHLVAARRVSPSSRSTFTPRTSLRIHPSGYQRQRTHAVVLLTSACPFDRERRLANALSPSRHERDAAVVSGSLACGCYYFAASRLGFVFSRTAASSLNICAYAR